VHAHDHHGHEHARLAADRRALAIALALLLGLFAAEIAAGLAAGSLALLADAGHMLTDAAALGFALFAAALAARPARGAWTFGFRRVEVLAAQANGITLLLAAIWIVYSAARRLVDPPDVDAWIVLVVALVGVAVNVVATAVLSRSSKQSLNVRAAYLHLATDLAAFAGTAVAAGLILATGWNRFDALAGLAVAGLMLWASVGLLRASGRIFLEMSPGDIDPDEVSAALRAAEDVVDVHDLHVWTVTSGFPALSAHVLVPPGVDCHAARGRLERMLDERFALTHTTLQVDHARPGLAKRLTLPLIQPSRRG
jgi:cobalt-zinc-cadmium efflux system protein